MLHVNRDVGQRVRGHVIEFSAAVIKHEWGCLSQYRGRIVKMVISVQPVRLALMILAALMLGLLLASCKAAGNLDPTFGNGGRVVSHGDAGAVAMAIQADGKIVTASSGALHRYNTDGSPDYTFGSGSAVFTNLGRDGGVAAVAIQPDGKIVAVGSVSHHFALVRYSADGSLDPTFGSDGRVETSVTGNDTALLVAIPLTEKELRSSYPATYEYLSRNKTKLLKRSKTDSSNWWLFPYPKNLSLYAKSKILSQVLSIRGNFALDADGKFYFLGGGTAGGNAIKVENDNLEQMQFLLGILNSRLTSYFVSQVASGFRSGFFAFGKSSLANVPIRAINFDDATDALRHRRIVTLVEQMLALHKRLATAQTAADREMYQRQIDATDAEIDALVYALPQGVDGGGD